MAEASPTVPDEQRRWRILAGVLVLASLLLGATAIAEVFTVDDCNYFATVHALDSDRCRFAATDAQ